jgi:hypothetical protein
MSLIQYLQIFVSVLILADVVIKLSIDTYKMIDLQKNRKGVLRLNWGIPSGMIQKSYFKFDKFEVLLIDTYRINETASFIVGLLILVFCFSKIL